MSTPLSPNYEKRDALLSQLTAVEERQAKLHEQLSDLIADESQFTRAMIQMETAENAKSNEVVVSEANREFHQRGTAILDQLHETHKEIRTLLDELRVLRTKTSQT